MPFQTTIAEILLVDPDQINKTTTHNDGITDISNLLAGEFVQSMTSEASPFTLPYSSVEGGDKSGLHVQVYRFTGTPGAAKSIHHPAVRHRFVMINDTDDTMTMLVSGQTGVAVSAGTQRELYCDGTDVIDVTSDRQIEFMMWIPGVPVAADEIIRLTIARNVDFAAAFAGSHVTSTVAANAQADFDLLKNDVSIGTIRFAASANSATFVGVSATSFADGDTLSVTAPNPADANLAGISMTFVGTKA